MPLPHLTRSVPMLSKQGTVQFVGASDLTAICAQRNHQLAIRPRYNQVNQPTNQTRISLVGSCQQTAGQAEREEFRGRANGYLPPPAPVLTVTDFMNWQSHRYMTSHKTVQLATDGRVSRQNRCSYWKLRDAMVTDNNNVMNAG